MPDVLIDPFAMPGMGSPITSTEIEFLAGPAQSWQIKGVVLDSSTVDSGNSPTTLLRRGLILGKITSSGKYKAYDPTATDGSEIARGILYDNTNMLNQAGSAVDKAGRIVVWAFDVKATQLFGLDLMARRQMANRIFFDDGWDDAGADESLVVAKTSDYTIVAADNNKLFTTRGAAGAVNFTLPTLARGLRFRFFVEADQTLTITSVPTDSLVVFNDLAADTIAFSTASEKIGGGFEVIANDNASKWLVFVNLGTETQTPVITT